VLTIQIIIENKITENALIFVYAKGVKTQNIWKLCVPTMKTFNIVLGTLSTHFIEGRFFNTIIS